MCSQKQGKTSWVASEMQTVFCLVGQMIFKQLSALMCTGFPDSRWFCFKIQKDFYLAAVSS